MSKIRVLALVLVVTLVGVAGDAAEPVRLQVLSYNIHHAEGGDRQLDLERIARVIRCVEPDLVAPRQSSDEAD